MDRKINRTSFENVLQFPFNQKIKRYLFQNIRQSFVISSKKFLQHFLRKIVFLLLVG